MTQSEVLLPVTAGSFETSSRTGLVQSRYSRQSVGSCRNKRPSWRSMPTGLINIEKAKYSLSGDQLYNEILVGASLPPCDHRPTCNNIYQERYRLAFDRIRMLVVTVWLQNVMASETFSLFELTTRRTSYPNLFCYKTLPLRAMPAGICVPGRTSQAGQAVREKPD